MEFKEYLAIIRRRWLLFFPIFALIVGAHLIWINYGQTNRYVATSKLIISDEPEISTTSSMIPLGLPDVSPLTKEATIKDYPILRCAAELALGRRPFLSPEFQKDEFRVSTAEYIGRTAGLFGNTEEGIREIVRVLQSSSDVIRPGDRQIVEINVEGEDTNVAMLLSWAMAEAAYQYHNERAAQNIEKFVTSTDRLMADAQSEMTAAHSELQEAQEQLGITNFADKERMILESLYSLDRKEDSLTAQARKNDRLIQHRLQEQSFNGRVDVGRDTELESSGRVGEIRQLLFQRKLDLDAKVSTLSTKHPDVKELRAQIASLQRAMAKEQDTVLLDKYKEFSRETNELIKNNSLIHLELEVLEESRRKLRSDQMALNSMRQDFVPKENRYKEAQERMASLAALNKQMQWLTQGNLGGVTVYDPAVMVDPVSVAGTGFGPLSLTLLMAFIFSLGVVYIVEYVDTRVKNEHDVRRHLNLPLLGVIPREPGSGGLLTDCPPQSEISEKFNTAATLIQSTSRDLYLRSIMVCSAIAREGKTTVSVNLAVALARKGARVVLVDGDLRISQVHNVLRLPNHVGLSTYLDPHQSANPMQVIEGVNVDDEMGSSTGTSVVNYVQRTQVEGLDVLTSGPPAADPVVLLDSSRLSRLVDELKQHYDFVIFDTPPINKVGDALTISSVMDGCAFVVGCGQAEQHDVTWAKHLLANVQANILGVFLNKFSKQRGSEYYYYYYNNDRKRKRVRSRA